MMPLLSAPHRGMLLIRWMGVLALLLALMGAAPGARAQLNVVLDIAVLSGPPGSTLTFTGTLQNTTASPLFLNGFDYDFGAAGPFFSGDIGASVPLSLGPNAGFTGDLFVVQIDGAAPPGPYTVGLTLLGGADDLASDTLATPFFQVNVTPAAVPTAAPEPPTFALLLPIAAGLLAAAAKSRPREGRQRLA